jgi:hypothetical protein
MKSKYDHSASSSELLKAQGSFKVGSEISYTEDMSLVMTYSESCTDCYHIELLLLSPVSEVQTTQHDTEHATPSEAMSQ